MAQIVKPKIKVTKLGRRDGYGCELLHVQLLENEVATHNLVAVTGQPWAQVFRHCTDRGAHAGSCEPIPQGWYKVEKVVYAMDEPWSRQVSRRTGKWVYNDGIGEWCAPMTPETQMERGNFLFHMDYNRSTSPGSGGCVTFVEDGHGDIFVEWRNRNEMPAIVRAEVQWGLR